jgi:predicted alpha/beta superfamily hydrolase
VNDQNGNGTGGGALQLGRADGPGRLRTLRRVRSAWLGNVRDVFVLLPPSYDADEAPRRYPVVYMHDGQNLFLDDLSYAGAWHVERAVDIAAGRGGEAIVVGIPNAGESRLDEYGPFREPTVRMGGHANAYLAFMLEQVKPLVDRRFRTRPEPEHTHVAGSSMGGLVSLYAFFSAPHRFGGCGALSPALWFGERAIFPWVERAPRVHGRVYLDVGTAEGRSTLTDARRLRDLLLAKGYVLGHDLKYVEENDALHEERAWGRRVHDALPFLLGLPDLAAPAAPQTPAAPEPAPAAIRDVVRDAVRAAVRDAVQDAVQDAMHDAMQEAVQDAMQEAVQDAMQGAVQDAVDGAMRTAAGDTAPTT